LEEEEHEAVTHYPAQQLANLQLGQPTYAELLGRLKRLEAEAHGHSKARERTLGLRQRMCAKCLTLVF
jgi:hypothetical protein